MYGFITVLFAQLLLTGLTSMTTKYRMIVLSNFGGSFRSSMRRHSRILMRGTYVCALMYAYTSVDVATMLELLLYWCIQFSFARVYVRMYWLATTKPT